MMSSPGPTDTTQAWLACPGCQAPLEATQRYCVTCGARHLEADDPAARYFGAVAQRRRVPVVRPARRGVGIGIAVLLAILPIAVGVGVVVGRSAHSDTSLVQALRDQKPTVVNVGGGGTSGSDVAATGSATSKDAGGASAGGTSSDTVVATGVGGTAHSVLHHTSTATSRAQDKQVVRNLTKQKGKSYIQSQKSLPDVVDVQSDPGAGTTGPTGAGD